MKSDNPASVPFLVWIFICVMSNYIQYIEVSLTNSKLGHMTTKTDKIPGWCLNVYPIYLMNRNLDVFANPNNLNASDLEQEMTRAGTFLLFPSNRSTPDRRDAYISAGFHYSRESDELHCHFCNATYNDWQGNGDLSKIHESNCKFSRKTEHNQGYYSDQMPVSEVSQSSLPPQNQQEEITPPADSALSVQTGDDENIKESSYLCIRHEEQTMAPDGEVLSQQLVISASSYMEERPDFQGEGNPHRNQTESVEIIRTGEALGACGGSDIGHIPQLHRGNNMTLGSRVEPSDPHGDLGRFGDRPEIGYDVGVIRLAYEQLRQEDVLKENTLLKEEKKCHVCFDRDIEVVILPCGHVKLCGDCSYKMETCPFCRGGVMDRIPFHLL